ncbi:site-specific integrase [Daejeonella sp.]|uniref:tyrosine-type recombinase/integrase n=1 Tax=Daejeonella sp. TaxID=2805397 RepID=UPI0030BFCAE8
MNNENSDASDSTWRAVVIRNRGHNRIAVEFEKTELLVRRFKKLKDAKWSDELGVWHLPDTQENRTRFKVETDKDKLQGKREHIDSFLLWLRSRRYAESTINTYINALKTFLTFYHNKTIGEITNNDVILFNNNFLLKNELSSSYQNQVVNAIKLFFNTQSDVRINVNLIHRPKKEKLLPNVLSKDEIKAILNAPRNIKHKAMLCLIYSCGLRRSELLNLKPQHIDSKRKLVLVKQSKGKKDRIVPLSEKIIIQLQQYYRLYRPRVWLFEGQNAGDQYSEKSLSSVLNQAVLKVKIQKPVTLHWLRHSYATHLLESGTDLRYIQEILGHSSSKTTEIYTHVSTKSIQNIKSPFDDLDI